MGSFVFDMMEWIVWDAMKSMSLDAVVESIVFDAMEPASQDSLRIQ